MRPAIPAPAAPPAAVPAALDIQDLILQDYPRISVFYGLILIPLYSLILFYRRLNQRDAIWLKKPDKKDREEFFAVF